MDLACTLVRILDCDFIVELLADSNLDKTNCRIADFASNLGGSADLYTPIHLFTPPPPFIAENLRILKFCLLNYYDGKTDVKSHVFQYTKLINYSTRKFAKKLYIK